jgi:ubiquinone/menaquinone biosynthesis C-methylase UbiE
LLLTKIIKNLADSSDHNSLAAKLRRKRFTLFNSLIESLPKPLNILDVGGTQIFWERMGLINRVDANITLINLCEVEVTYPNFISIIGDGRDMTKFKNKEFDVIFSNSVIEHVGHYEQQRELANEVRRVGKRYFLQTPNRYFPIEPHFLFPFFQFLPLKIKVFLLIHFSIGWYKKISQKQKASQEINAIRLLNERQLKNLFPEAKIYREKFLGLTKSLLAYSGWE